MRSRRLRAIILIILLTLLAILIGVGIYYFFFYGSSNNSVDQATTETEQTETTTQQNDVQTDQVATQDNQQQPEPTESPEPEPVDTQLRAQQLARVFVERFGTYSNQNNNSHIESVLPMSTQEMQQWIKSQTVDQKQDYQGQTTNVISTSLSEIDKEQGEATVMVQVRQISQTTSGQSNKQREAKVELIQQDNSWLVDGLYWQ